LLIRTTSLQHQITTHTAINHTRALLNCDQSLVHATRILYLLLPNNASLTLRKLCIYLIPLRGEFFRHPKAITIPIPTTPATVQRFTMPVEVSLNTPLAEALNAAIQPKLVEVGWGTGGADDSALAEYIILMLVNGKTQDQIAAELSGDLLGLGSDDPSTRDFSQWLFEQIDALNTQVNGGSNAGPGTSQDATTEGEMDTDMNAGDVSELNA
jgi:hypothetical protein